MQESKIPNYIAIEGPIGVGKTSLSRKIALEFGHELCLEESDENPFLKSFYNSSTEGFPNWDVLSSVGKVNNLYTLSSEIGCEYWGIEKNNIGHNLRSALIGPDKTLLKIWEGDDWLAGSVSNEIENYIEIFQ